MDMNLDLELELELDLELAILTRATIMTAKTNKVLRPNHDKPKPYFYTYYKNYRLDGL